MDNLTDNPKLITIAQNSCRHERGGSYNLANGRSGKRFPSHPDKIRQVAQHFSLRGTFKKWRLTLQHLVSDPPRSDIGPRLIAEPNLSK